jgi:hypothetical protein
LGFVVDDKIEPAPENIPTPTENDNIEATDGLAWGWAGIDHRKHASYTMKIMSMYGSLLVSNGQKDYIRHYGNEAGQKVTTRFKYTEPFVNHFLYRHCVDDHNNL